MSSTTDQASKSGTSKMTESYFTRIFVTPLLFISFIISLFLIDRDTYAHVLNGHSSPDRHYHSRQGKLAKQTMEDAFHMRNRVLAAIFIFAGVGFAVLGWSGSRAWCALFPGC